MGVHLSGALGCKHVVGGGGLHGAVTCRRRSVGARKARAGHAGVRRSGVGPRAGGALARPLRTFASACIRPSGSGHWRSSESPSSRARRGSSAAIGQGARTIGRGRSWKCVGHRSALEGFAFHLPPNPMAQPVSNEGAVGRGRYRVLGWAHGGYRVDRTICGPSFRRKRPHMGLDAKPALMKLNVGACKRKWLSGISASRCLGRLWAAKDVERAAEPEV